MSVLIYLLISSLSVIITAYLLPGVSVNNFFTAITVAVIMGVINKILKPILLILTLPINILSLGLFTFVINGLLVLLMSALVPGFYVDGFLQAVLFSIVISLTSTVLNWVVK